MADPGLIAWGVGVALTIAWFVFVPPRRLREEQGIVPLYSERCSGMATAGIGLRFAVPLRKCRLALYDAWFVADVGGPIIVKYSDVEKVRYRSRWFSRRIQIYRRGMKLVTTFYVHRPDEAAAVFKQMGVRVEVG